MRNMFEPKKEGWSTGENYIMRSFFKTEMAPALSLLF